MNKMIQLIYVSSAVWLLSEKELIDLLNKARARNISRNVTGMLLYAGGKFLQVLEGNSQDVEETYALIQKDIRHAGLQILNKETISERNFPNWSMGFKYLTEQETKNIKGYTDILNIKQNVHKPDIKNVAKHILYKFKEVNT
ncbi:MAG: BLUF domain-containing protein [Gammaproteobacteria bacterium]|nr:BLUF domain-containing protein [Gammaproteobacteria bacterium]